MTTPLVIVGAGRWGALHAGKLATLPQARLVAVVDPDLARARAVAATVPGAVALPDPALLGRLPEPPKAALVSTDIPNLAPAARGLLEQGLHVLVEKPAAATVALARGLETLARTQGRVLAVGFVERFNGALAGLPAEGRRLVIRRSGPAAPGAGPLHLDWLIHDLDLALWRLGEGLVVRAVRAEGPSSLVVRLEGPDGRAAQLRVTRGAQQVRRRLWLDGRRVDLAARGAEDPLTLQWQAFLQEIRGVASPRLARGRDAVQALALAERIEDLARAPAAARAAG